MTYKTSQRDILVYYIVKPKTALYMGDAFYHALQDFKLLIRFQMNQADALEHLYRPAGSPAGF